MTTPVCPDLANKYGHPGKWAIHCGDLLPWQRPRLRRKQTPILVDIVRRLKRGFASEKDIFRVARYPPQASQNRTSDQLITTFAETSVGCRTNARVDAVRPLNRHGLNSRTARDPGVPVVPLVFNTMYDVALPGLGGEKRVYAAGCRL